MNIKIHSAELNRMMKTICQCIDPKDSNRGNIEVIFDNSLLSIRGTNGAFSAVMSTPLLGGDGESFCVDGTMFARVVGMCNGEVEISTDNKICTIKGAGRTRIPIVNANLAAFEPVTGDRVTIGGADFIKCYNAVSYAVSVDQSRPMLTGVLVESEGESVRMVALDGFQMAIESTVCDGKKLRAVIPGQFMKLIANSIAQSDKVNITVTSSRVQASTDGMMIACGLLSGKYPEYEKIMPDSFKTESVLSSDALRNALKSGSVVNNSNNLIKVKVYKDEITVMSNSEQADFEAEVSCNTNGSGLVIAFNQKYLMNTINAVNAEEIVMKFNAAMNPCVVQGKNEKGIHLVLPVRLA